MKETKLIGAMTDTILLLPYIKEESSERYLRESSERYLRFRLGQHPVGNEPMSIMSGGRFNCYAKVWYDSYIGFWNINCNALYMKKGFGKYKTVLTAQRYLDRFLIKNGCRLLTAEQADRLLPLY